MADAAGWHRFTQVTEFVPSGHKLYRSSAPNYKSRDSDQVLTQAAVDFLVSQGIDSVISLNGNEYSPTEKDRLARANPPIRYLHLRLGDFKPPTLEQFTQANDFFRRNKSTLVHCGYGHGRTGTCITGLQIYAENGRSLRPLAESWCTRLSGGGNNVETREQVSVLAELRNLLLPRVTGNPAGDPEQGFAIINFATGYYLTLSTDKQSVVSLLPESVEATSAIEQAYQWVVSKDDQDNYTLSNKTTPTGVALTNSQGANVNDLVTYGTETQGNALFTITQVASGDQGRYVISPKSDSTLAVAIDPVGSERIPALLTSKNEENKFGLWILLRSKFEAEGQGKSDG